MSKTYLEKNLHVDHLSIKMSRKRGKTTLYNMRMLGSLAHLELHEQALVSPSPLLPIRVAGPSSLAVGDRVNEQEINHLFSITLKVGCCEKDFMNLLRNPLFCFMPPPNHPCAKIKNENPTYSLSFLDQFI